MTATSNREILLPSSGVTQQRPDVTQNSRYLDALQQRVLVFDGAFGTTVQAMNLTEADFGGHEGLNDYLGISRPDIVERIHTEFLEVGADVLETFTFGSNRLKLGEYGIPDEVYAVNVAAARIARRL